MTQVDQPLARALLLFLMADNPAEKLRILAENPGLRSPQVCLKLCEQAEDEFSQGNVVDAHILLINLDLILEFNSGWQHPA